MMREVKDEGFNISLEGLELWMMENTPWNVWMTEIRSDDVGDRLISAVLQSPLCSSKD